MTGWPGAARLCALTILLSGCALKPVELVLAEPPRPADPFIATIEAMKHSVAPVICLDGDGPQAGILDLEGTAFFISRSGDFLTAAHVIDGIRDHTHSCPVAAIYLPSDHWDPQLQQETLAWYPFLVADCEFHRDVDVAKCKPLVDLALHRDKLAFEIRPVKFEWASQPDGTLIAFTGFPLGFRDPLTSRGGVAAYTRMRVAGILTQSTVDLIIDQTAWPGASGAPVYLSDGRVVGMLVARGVQEGEGTAVVRPAQLLQRITERVGVQTSLIPR
jgi:hypothetical protein